MKKLRRLFICFLVIPAVLCAACATIVSKSIYPVEIKSRPDGANISITNNQGIEVYSGVTPATVPLKAGSGFFQGEDYIVTFKKSGFDDFSTKINRNLDNWYLLGNFVIGGLIGWLIVDPATGAMWTLDNVNAILLEKKTGKLTDGACLNIVLFENIPKDFYSKLIKLN